MGGGLMQLVAYGAQDIYLTGNPQITFFKVVYRRHTNFSMEAIQQSFSGETQSTASSVTATISRNGDLVHKMWLDIKMNTAPESGTTYTNWTNNTGHAFIKDCEIEIGSNNSTLNSLPDPRCSDPSESSISSINVFFSFLVFVY